MWDDGHVRNPCVLALRPLHQRPVHLRSVTENIRQPAVSPATDEAQMLHDAEPVGPFITPRSLLVSKQRNLGQPQGFLQTVTLLLASKLAGEQNMILDGEATW